MHLVDYLGMVSDPSDSRLVRVRKLLRLAQSSNPHEASSAAEEAQALISRYGIAQEDLDDAINDTRRALQSGIDRARQRSGTPALLLPLPFEHTNALPLHG